MNDSLRRAEDHSPVAAHVLRAVAEHHAGARHQAVFSCWPCLATTMWISGVHIYGAVVAGGDNGLRLLRR
jgi:hypothetical protein